MWRILQLLQLPIQIGSSLCLLQLREEKLVPKVITNNSNKQLLLVGVNFTNIGPAKVLFIIVVIFEGTFMFVYT